MTDVDRKTKNIVVRCLRPYKGYGLPRERVLIWKRSRHHISYNTVTSAIITDLAGADDIVTFVRDGGDACVELVTGDAQVVHQLAVAHVPDEQRERLLYGVPAHAHLAVSADEQTVEEAILADLRKVLLVHILLNCDNV